MLKEQGEDIFSLFSPGCFSGSGEEGEWEGGSIGSPLLRVAVKSHTNPGGEICYAGSGQEHNKIQTGMRSVYKC